jgi:uncharacterized membrane protein YccC
MSALHLSEHRKRQALHIALSYYVSNGLSAALGLLLISASVHLLLGSFAAAAASVGVVVCIPPDQPAPQRGKFWQLLPALLLGLPLFYGVQVLHTQPISLGVLLVSGSFFAFLAGAWGKRGLPISVSIMFAMVFSMAVPNYASSATNLSASLYFALGGAAYLVWATLANSVLNPRYRVQMLADTLLALAQLMRTQSRQFAPVSTETGGGNEGVLIGALLQQQAALADQLQTARDILLESPRTPRRQQLASMLLRVLEMRDHLLACELDLDTLKDHVGHAPVLGTLRDVLDALANGVEQLADAMLLGKMPASIPDLLARLAALQWSDDAPVTGHGAAHSPAVLARGLASRMVYLNDDTRHLYALARGEEAPDVGLVRTNWQLFVSPTVWSWQPFYALWGWKAAPLRHAIRAALAIATAYVIALASPWGTHDYWIFLTIVVVLRGSLAQTLDRRNSRVAGTLIGCIVAGLLLYVHTPIALLLVIATLAQAFAHAFAVKRYLVTAVAATVLGLLQVHMLNAGSNPSFEALERIADTLLGAAIAWAFSYLLPSWERTRIADLVQRTLTAQARHAREALGLWQLQAVDNEPELRWRLARREVYDSLSALVQATQRSLSEPRAVRPPLEPLGRMLAYSYQLQAQLTTVKTMLLQRRGRLAHAHIEGPLKQSALALDALLSQSQALGPEAIPVAAASESLVLPDPFESDLTPWLLRRLDLAIGMAEHLRRNADQVLHEVGPRNAK